MSYFFKFEIAKAISNCFNSQPIPSIEKIISNIYFNEDPKTNQVFFRYFPKNENKPNIDDLLVLQNETIKNVELHDNKINFYIDERKLYDYALTQGLTCRTFTSLKQPSDFVIDYSSPNVAKPFHYGHVRSTIIGNFISNILEYLNNRVVRLNYLGDWGVQFGLLQYGLDKFEVDVEKLAENPLRNLYDIYVKANKLAEIDPVVNEQSKQIFYEMEFATKDNKNRMRWLEIKKHTMKEFSDIYQRLGIRFDEYDWESDYCAEKIQSLVDKLKNENILIKKDDALVIQIKGNTVPFIKKDGTTLYLSRDLAAVLDRYKRYKFDKMLYVVDNSQAKHFKLLTEIVAKVQPECSQKLEHIQFGRVMGFSTRKGTAIFLNDMLDEMKELLELKRIQSPLTKGDIGGEIADILGISMIIAYDFKNSRNSNYEFSWKDVLQIEGNTGAKLQYNHCRLFSLEQNCKIEAPNEYDLSVLNESEAISLLITISRFEDAIVESYNSLEPKILLMYLFDLCSKIHKAYKSLRVMGVSAEKAEQRLLLFRKSKMVLNTGMKILGIKPLNQM